MGKIRRAIFRFSPILFLLCILETLFWLYSTSGVACLGGEDSDKGLQILFKKETDNYQLVNPPSTTDDTILWLESQMLRVNSDARQILAKRWIEFEKKVESLVKEENKLETRKFNTDEAFTASLNFNSISSQFNHLFQARIFMPAISSTSEKPKQEMGFLKLADSQNQHFSLLSAVIFILSLVGLCSYKSFSLSSRSPARKVEHSLFFILFMISVASASNAQTSTTKELITRSFNSEALRMLKNVTTDTNGFTFSLKNMVCKGITVGGLNSSRSQPSGIEFLISSVGINCNAHWSYKQDNLPIISGSGTVDVIVANSQLLLEIILEKDADGLAKDAKLTKCNPKIIIKSIDFSGGLTGFVLELFKSLIGNVIETNLDSIACTEFTQLVNTNLSLALQDINSRIKPYLIPPVPATAPYVPPGMADLRNSSIVGLIDYIFDDLVGPNGVLGLNKIIRKVTNGTGTLSLKDLKTEATLPLSSLGNLTFGVLGVNMSGLDTWGAFDILEPTSNYTLSSLTSLEALNISINFFVNVTLSPKGIIKAPFLYERGTLIANLQKNVLNSTLQLAIDSKLLGGLATNQLLSPGCILDSLYNINTTMLAFNFTISQLSLIADGGSAEKQLDNLIDNVLGLFIDSFMPAIPALFNGVVGGPIRRVINDEFERVLEANATCAAPNTNTPSTFGAVYTIISFSVAGVVFLLLLAILFFMIRCKKQQEEDLDFLEPLIAPETSNKKLWYDSLVLDSNVSLFLRGSVTFLIIANIALFISSHTSVGASVYLILNVSGDKRQLPSIFDFSLGNSVRDMWTAKVYGLSLLIAIFSGAWPYIKLILMLFCWLAPVRLLNVKRREYFLMALDALGKWSLIDAFVLTLMMVAFHFHIAPPKTTRIHEGSISIDAFVEPHWGFYGFLIATMASLSLSHIILAFHRKTKHDALGRLIDPVDDHKKEALWSHAFKSSESLSRPVVTNFLTVLITALLIFSITLVVVGASIYSFEFKFKGALGLILDYTGQSSTQPYSLITVGMSLPESSSSPNGLGVRLVQATYFTFAFAVPLTYLTFLLLLWLTPLTAKLQRSIFIATEILNAWSALEVFVISVIAALLEVQQFAQFIIGNRCDLLNQIFSKYFDNILDGDDKCFDVVATLDNGCWLLFAGCIIHVVVGTIVIRMCHKALEEREEPTIVKSNSMIINPSSSISETSSDDEKYSGSSDKLGINY